MLFLATNSRMWAARLLGSNQEAQNHVPTKEAGEILYYPGLENTQWPRPSTGSQGNHPLY